MHLYFIQDFVCAASKNKTIFQARCKWTNLTLVYWRNKNKHRTRISEIFRSRHKFKSKHLFIRFILRETLCCCLFNFFTWPYSADTVTSTDLHLQPKFWYFFHEMSLMVFPTVYSNHFVALLLAVYFQSRYVCVRLPYQVSKSKLQRLPPAFSAFFMRCCKDSSKKLNRGKPVVSRWVLKTFQTHLLICPGSSEYQVWVDAT